MLTALENGVKGNKWFSLIDKVYTRPNLHVAFEKVKANGGAAGVDQQTIEMFEANLEANLEELGRHLREGTYRPQEIRRVWIPKPGTTEKRGLGIPTVRDRVVQAAIRHVIEPIFERDFAEHSYGFRPQRGCKDALRRVDHLLEEGYHYVVDADLKRYFDTIPHQPLMAQIRTKIADSRLLDVIEVLLRQGVLPLMTGWQPEEGVPQGAVISPLLSNLYLDPLDHLMAKSGIEMVRYADDLVIMCRTAREAQNALAQLQDWATAAGLTLHPDKTRIVDATQPGGFDFLGYRFEPGRRCYPSRKSLNKFRTKVRDTTKRTAGRSLAAIVSQLNPIVRGWFNYFKHAHHTTFRTLDSWIRMRLRSILRKNRGGKGRGHGLDHQRWPNKYFTQLGLYSLATAWTEARQSPSG